MDLTVQNLIVDSMSLIGATAIDETPTASELALGLRTANMMIDRWSSIPNLLRARDSISFPVTEGKGTYTIGEYGCDINFAKPVRVITAFVRDAANINYALDIIEKSTYDSLQDRTVSSGRPSMIVYNPVETAQETPYGEFYVYYRPDRTYTVFVDLSKEITQFETLTELIEFEPFYYEAIKYGIAVRLFRHYHAVTIPVPVDLLAREQETLKTLYTLNSRTPLAASDMPRQQGRYNIYTDRG